MILKSIQSNLTVPKLHKIANSQEKLNNLVLKAFALIILMNNYKEVCDIQEAIHFSNIGQIRQENGNNKVLM